MVASNSGRPLTLPTGVTGELIGAKAKSGKTLREVAAAFGGAFADQVFQRGFIGVGSSTVGKETDAQFVGRRTCHPSFQGGPTAVWTASLPSPVRPNSL
jgi:hypothetical protein